MPPGPEDACGQRGVRPGEHLRVLGEARLDPSHDGLHEDAREEARLVVVSGRSSDPFECRLAQGADELGRAPSHQQSPHGVAVLVDMAQRVLHLGGCAAAPGEVVARLGVRRCRHVVDDTGHERRQHALLALEVGIERCAADIGRVEYLLHGHARVAPLVEQPLERADDRRLGAGDPPVGHSFLPNVLAPSFESERKGMPVCCIDADWHQL